MTDIVERLRQGWRIELSDEELCEAADEIERLREALRNLTAYADLPQAERNWNLWELTIAHARTALGEKK